MALSWSAALTTAVVMFPEQPAVGAVAIAAAVPFFALAFLLRPALIALAVVAALLAVGRAELPPVDPAVPLRAAAVAGSTVLMTGRVADDSRSVAGGAEVLVEPNNLVVGVTKLAGVGNLLVRWRGPTQASYGDLMRASGRLTLPRDLPGFDRRAYLSQRQVYLELQASSFDVTSSAAGPGALPSWLRSRYIADVNAALPAPHAAVLLGIVLGIRQGIPAELQNALIATGLIHLLVLSGLKVAVFARIVQGALNPLLGRYAAWPAVALIALYAMVGGATPAAVRASAMGGLAIAASHLGRPSHVWTSLAVTAAAMLGWHPELAWDVGFQLSFAGTAAIHPADPSHRPPSRLPAACPARAVRGHLRRPGRNPADDGRRLPRPFAGRADRECAYPAHPSGAGRLRPRPRRPLIHVGPGPYGCRPRRRPPRLHRACRLRAGTGAGRGDHDSNVSDLAGRRVLLGARTSRPCGPLVGRSPEGRTCRRGARSGGDRADLSCLMGQRPASGRRHECRRRPGDIAPRPARHDPHRRGPEPGQAER